MVGAVCNEINLNSLEQLEFCIRVECARSDPDFVPGFNGDSNTASQQACPRRSSEIYPVLVSFYRNIVDDCCSIIPAAGTVSGRDAAQARVQDVTLEHDGSIFSNLDHLHW